MTRRSGNWSFMTFAVFVIEMAVFSLTTPKFFSFSGWMSMTNNFMAVGVMALSMTFVIIGGGIDLSVGSMMSLCGVMMGIFWHAGLSIWISALLAVVVGGVAGLVNGLIIVRTGIQPLIATLATLFIYGSLAVVLGGQGSIYGFPSSFLLIGSGYLFGIVPMELLVFAVLAVLFGFLLQRTIYGRMVYFIGNNENASMYSGVPVGKVKTWTYVVSGLTAGLASILLGSYFASVRGDMGVSFELTVITVCLVGGVNVFGGSGSLVGVVLGTFILGMLQQGLNLLNVSTVEQSIVTGLILILAVGMQQIGNLLQRVRSRRITPVAATSESTQGG